jgi:hypothetical protein
MADSARQGSTRPGKSARGGGDRHALSYYLEGCRGIRAGGRGVGGSVVGGVGLIRLNLALRFVKVGSHRAGSRITAHLGRKPQYYWTWKTAGCLVLMNLRQWKAMRGIACLSLWNPEPKGEHNPGKCWGGD